MKRALLLLLACHTLHADVSEQYEDYVNKVVPATYVLAEQSARAREALVATSRMAEVQVLINDILTSIEVFRLFAEKVVADSEPPGCPKVLGAPDIPATLRALSAASLALNYWQGLVSRVETFEIVEKERNEMCEKENAFSDYRAVNLPFRFYTPSEIKAYEGVSFTYTVSDQSNGSNQNSDSGGDLVAVLNSMVQIFKNETEKSRLGKLQHRLWREKVSDAAYREFARLQCKQIRKETDGQFSQYSAVSRATTRLLSKLPAKLLQNRVNFLNTCLVTYESEYADYVKRLAQKSTERAMAERATESNRLKQKSEILGRVGEQLLWIRGATCDSADAQKVLNALERDQILYRLQGFESLPDVMKAANSVAVEWREKCKAAK